MASRIGIVVFAAILSLSCAQQVLRVRGRPRNGARAIAPARPKSFAPVPVAPLGKLICIFREIRFILQCTEMEN